MGEVDRALVGHHRVGLDTSVFIYALEQHPRYVETSRAVLRAIEARHFRGIASVVSLMELTVRPFQLGDLSIVRHYESHLVNYPNLDVLDANTTTALEAAQLRATYGLAPADALVIATAIGAGATAFVTNDHRLQRVSELTVLTIDGLVHGP